MHIKCSTNVAPRVVLSCSTECLLRAVLRRVLRHKQGQKAAPDAGHLGCFVVTSGKGDR